MEKLTPPTKHRSLGPRTQEIPDHGSQQKTKQRFHQHINKPQSNLGNKELSAIPRSRHKRQIAIRPNRRHKATAQERRLHNRRRPTTIRQPKADNHVCLMGRGNQRHLQGEQMPTASVIQHYLHTFNKENRLRNTKRNLPNTQHRTTGNREPTNVRGRTNSGAITDPANTV